MISDDGVTIAMVRSAAHQKWPAADIFEIDYTLEEPSSSPGINGWGLHVAQKDVKLYYEKWGLASLADVLAEIERAAA